MSTNSFYLTIERYFTEFLADFDLDYIDHVNLSELGLEIRAIGYVNDTEQVQITISTNHKTDNNLEQPERVLNGIEIG